MRVSTNQLMGIGLEAIQRNSTEVMNYQQQISSGNRYQKASDSGLAAGLSVQVVLDQSQYSMFKVNQDYLTAKYSSAQTQVSSINDMLTRFQQLMVQAGNDAIGTSGRQAIAQEMTSLKTSIDQAASAKDANGIAILIGAPQPAPPPPLPPLQPPTEPHAIEVANNVYLPSGVTYSSVMGTVAGTNPGQSIDQILQSVIDTVGGTSGASAAAPTSVQSTNMGLALTQVNTALVSVGVLQNRLTAATDMANTQKTNVDTQRSNLLDTDLAAASAGLMKSNALLSAAQSVMAKMDVNSLFSKL